MSDKVQIPNMWEILASVAWGSPEIAYPYTYVWETDVQGVASGQGVAAEVDTRMITGRFFVGDRVDITLELDSAAAADGTEEDAANYLRAGILDKSRQLDYQNTLFPVASIAGTRLKPGRPWMPSVPFTFAPKAEIVARFQPVLGFPVGANSLTSLTTRHVVMHMHGYMVAAKYYEKLQAQREQAVLKALGLGG